MHKNMAAALAIILSSNQAVADNHDLTLDACKALNAATPGHFEKSPACVSLLRERLLGLENDLNELKKLVSGEGENAVQHSHQDQVWPSGAVVMFAENHTQTNDQQSPCPPKWSLLQEAAGRMPIGAGQPLGKLNAEFSNLFGKYNVIDPETGDVKSVDLRPYSQDATGNWLFYRLLEVGGAETVTLTKEQMPNHGHYLVNLRRAYDEVKTADGVTVGQSFGDGAAPGRLWIGGSPIDVRQNTSEAGDRKPHNNMPPYIALYFCKKD